MLAWCETPVATRSSRHWPVVMCLLTICAVIQSTPVRAQAPESLVVGNDRGGFLHDRLVELENLERNGVQVRIQGAGLFFNLYDVPRAVRYMCGS